MKFMFDDPTFSYEALRTLSYAPYGGADVSEVLTTAAAIEENNFESWYTHWLALADRVFARGKSFEQTGHMLSASQNYLKASNYYRSAEFFLHGNPDDPRLLATWSMSRDAFQKGIRLSNQCAEIVAIPYEDTTMPGYLYTIDDQPRPTLLVHGGYDSTGDELYFQVVIDALAHGYNAMTFEGPGQGAMIREQHLPFRPDWENVVGPALDFLEQRAEVQSDKIALMGISFGGFLAPRAAAFDHRLAAVIADDGVFTFSFADAFAARGHEGATFKDIEPTLKMLMAKSSNVRWVIDNGLFTFGVKTIEDLFNKTTAYSMAGIADKIQCPIFIGDAAGDGFFKGQPQHLYNAIQSPKTLVTFGPEDGAEEHCQMGALNYFNQRVFNWLDDTLQTN
ncbi:alpha/beta hydrolase family protein [Secundilactobacillus paracollinoides]|uniref:Alpha/beta hydrolase n=2 Tax=Secundilactobacillus paracollinoides TaxID=240427 RepID=A0A1B2IUK9_9LACO|nr:alpha/beta fold hydrolase [Secundilactobacillus paracollinoides]ANZ59945.1 alpha/beta hydrolase [Secundilactobacillus paracollinoides]ANZ65736.1 alpha/beta hydrolase [Secundilactobacillus paracollinoides]